MNEEREVNPDGTTSCGVFLPLPYDLAKDFPDKWEKDSSEPHITLLYVGDLSPTEFKKLVDVVREAATYIAPFEADLQRYHEFTNNEGQRIPHMMPSFRVNSLLARIHGIIRRAAENENIKIEHTYGPQDNDRVPYEIRFHPHATLDYLDADAPMYQGPKPTGTWHVNELEVWGHETIRVPLGRNRYNQPSGLRRDPLAIHYPMAVPEPAKESLAIKRSSLLLESSAINEYRDSCGDCVRKHLGQAAALMDEARQGYPAHRWLAVGHLGEAASEALKEYPKLADEIRKHRIKYIADPDYSVPVVELIEKVNKLVNESREKFRDQLPGGLADKNKPSDFDPEQLRMGIEVEKEHTSDPKKALEIAMDHLREIPDYYDRLKRMEKQAGVEESKTNSKSKFVHPLAIEARSRARSDEKAGHEDAAEYWRGWAAGSFLTSRKGERDKSVAEAETSLKGYETHHGVGGSAGSITKDGTLKWLNLLKKQEKKKGRGLGLRRTALDAG